jgi:hypothetical protein
VEIRLRLPEYYNPSDPGSEKIARAALPPVELTGDVGAVESGGDMGEFYIQVNNLKQLLDIVDWYYDSVDYGDFVLLKDGENEYFLNKIQGGY